MKIATIVGARPQFIKAAVVSRALVRRGRMTEDIIHTGQHYDDLMSDVFFRELEIPPPRLSLGVGSGSHAAQTGRMLEAVERALADLKPDMVLVYGDTNSTLAGALAASKMNLPVAHVEAGLRSFARAMPEEINRVVADHLSTVLFPPTDLARDRLVVEGLADRRIVVTGDVMYDAVLHARTAGGGVTTKPESGYLLATIHRAENTDDRSRLGAIMRALVDVSRDLPVILPLHPRTRAAIAGVGMPIPENGDRFRIIDPVGYLEMQRLEAGASLIVTDSGGVQKEAYWHGVPCVTTRNETEWTELVAVGWNVLAPPGATDISRVIREALVAERGPRPDLFGDGTAGERVAAALEAFSEREVAP